MKTMLRSLAMCFSMYSRLPMPRVDWEKGSMKYVFCFFPLIGVLIGGLELGWYALAVCWGLNTVLYAAGAALLPVLVTGGIHLDGFLDTCDALFSYGDREKKLEIMKDPRAGAFAVIYCGVYLLGCFGLFAQLYQNASFQLTAGAAVGFVLSRCICGLCTVSMPCARTSGLAHMFQNSSEKKSVRILLSLVALLCLAGICLLSWKNGLITLGLLAMLLVIFIPYCLKQFGGITGDLAGFILELAELAVLVSCLFVLP